MKLKTYMKTSLKILLTFVLFVSGIAIIYAQDFFQTIENGDYEKVEQFLHEEPNLLDSIVKWECTPLMFASYWGKDTIVELLLKNGADMYKFRHENGRLSLHLATLQKHAAVVDVLINNGMDVNVKDGADKTALFYAIEENNKEIIDLLLKHNAKLPEEQKLMNLCLHSAVLYSLQYIADRLLENGASLSGLDNKGRSLLHNAVIGENLKWVELLIEKNIDINKEDSYKRIPLHYSVESNQLEITKLLIKSGAKINAIDCTNRTPLDIAKGLVFVQVTDFLEDNGGLLSEPMVFKIAGDKEEQQEIKVTYIANMGVLISSASKTVLIDGLFIDRNNTYLSTPKNIVAKINNLEPPFDSLDLILVTHRDGDHFSASMIADYLAINKSVKVVCNNNTSLALKENIDPSIDSTRIVGITPGLFSTTDTLVNNIKIKVLRLRHSNRDDQNDNLGFLIDMDGIKVFHQGDAGGEVKRSMVVKRVQEYDSIGIEAMEIDVAILNRGSLWNSNSPGLQIIKEQMKPKHIILTHFSDNDKQGEWETVERTIKIHDSELPELTSFKWSMQEIIIKKGF